MSGLIWHNNSWTIFVIDIPESIAAAQVPTGQPVTSQLLSSKPHTTTWPVKKGVNNFRSPQMQDYHKELAPVVTSALGEIKAALGGAPWCNTRAVSDDMDHEVPTQLLKNIISGHPYVQETDILEHSGEENDMQQGESVSSIQTIQAYGPAAKNVNDYKTEGTRKHAGDQNSPDSTGRGNGKRLRKDPRMSTTFGYNDRFKILYHNPEDHTVKLTLQPDPAKQGGAVLLHQHFRIPARATILLADCNNGHLLTQSVNKMSDDYDQPKRFDLLLMDPPWPNRSAKKKGDYQTFEFVHDMNSMWDSMGIDKFLAQGTHVAIWLTNSEIVREAVLGTDGLFEHWGLDFVEEWVWVKTTPAGVPFCSPDCQFRKPWETLVIGRKDWSTLRSPDAPVTRRVFAATPDLHSRKPCLKYPLEQLLRLQHGYTAMEIFARTATTGWWSYGFEAIKFNWEKYWVKKPEEKAEQKEEQKKEQGEQGEQEKNTTGRKRKASSVEE